MMNRDIKTISLFSGCGGIDVGFKKAGFRTLFANDNWEDACETLRRNKISKIVECRDVRELNYKNILSSLKIKKFDCLIAGPPCPPYSKSRFYLKNKKRALDDSQAYTLLEFLRALKELKPKVFFFENVFGFVYKPHKAAFDLLKKTSEELGYVLAYKVVNAANYGVPQTRERFICIGALNAPQFQFPKETHAKPEKLNNSLEIFIKSKKPWITAGDVIGDIDDELPEDKKFEAGSKHKNLLKLVPPGNNYLFFTKERGYTKPIFKWRSRYWSFLLKLSPDKPSWTIQASPSNNMGPFHWKNRFLRIQEIKRLQTFDDDFELVGDWKSQWRQIGNAVPPLLAQKIAEEIKEQYF